MQWQDSWLVRSQFNVKAVLVICDVRDPVSGGQTNDQAQGFDNAADHVIISIRKIPRSIVHESHLPGGGAETPKACRCNSNSVTERRHSTSARLSRLSWSTVRGRDVHEDMVSVV